MNAISSGVIPDPRRSPALQDAAVWRGIVIDGVRKDNGMETQALHNALLNDQTINTAVGILMERLRLPRAEAFARLRQHLRSERRKVAELAAEFVSTSEELIRRLHVIGGACD